VNRASTVLGGGPGPTDVYGRNIVAPPGNQAENGENKPHSATSEETGLLDKGLKCLDVFTLCKYI